MFQARAYKSKKAMQFRPKLFLTIQKKNYCQNRQMFCTEWIEKTANILLMN